MIRSGIVLAAHGGVLKRLLLPFKLGMGGKQGSGKQWMSWIALADEVGAIMHALGTDTLHGPVNLTAPQPVTNAEFAQTLGRVLHRPTFLPTPALPLKLVYGDELVETLLMGGPARVAGPPASERLRVPAQHPRGCAPCGAGSTLTSATTPTTPSRCCAPRHIRTSS